MTARIIRQLGLAAGALAIFVAAPARAGMGDGIRLGGGEGVLHPFFEIASEYDTNVYAEKGGQGDLIFHFRPGVKVDVPGDMVAIDGRAALERVQYLGMGTDTADISGWWGDAGLRLSVNPKGRVGFELREAFRRSNQVQALSLTMPALSNYNMLSATVPFMPGGGALIFALGGDWAIEGYEPLGGEGVCSTDPVLASDPYCSTAILKKLGYTDLQGRGSAIWKFLPRTQATLDVGYSQRIPNETDPAAAGYSPRVGTLRALAGLSGLVTTQFGATIRAGYGATSATGANVGTWLATVEGEWIPVAEASVKAGYSHGVGTEPGALYAVFSTNRLSLDAQYKVARRYTAKLGVRYDMLAYQVSQNDSTASILNVEPALGAEAAKWLHVDVGYSFTRRDTNFKVTATTPTGAPVTEPETFDFSRSLIYLRASVIY
ncbi:MAG TPA: hypothetical protein VLT47_06185 [Anaeromyxobacteraceae bacterium]|nr:hypothetical protein [Anaeromyxobacteraceae bacterium]